MSRARVPFPRGRRPACPLPAVGAEPLRGRRPLNCAGIVSCRAKTQRGFARQVRLALRAWQARVRCSDRLAVEPSSTQRVPSCVWRCCRRGRVDALKPRGQAAQQAEHDLELEVVAYKDHATDRPTAMGQCSALLETPPPCANQTVTLVFIILKCLRCFSHRHHV